MKLLKKITISLIIAFMLIETTFSTKTKDNFSKELSDGLKSKADKIIDTINSIFGKIHDKKANTTKIILSNDEIKNAKKSLFINYQTKFKKAYDELKTHQKDNEFEDSLYDLIVEIVEIYNENLADEPNLPKFQLNDKSGIGIKLIEKRNSVANKILSQNLGFDSKNKVIELKESEKSKYLPIFESNKVSSFIQKNSKKLYRVSRKSQNKKKSKSKSKSKFVDINAFNNNFMSPQRDPAIDADEVDFSKHASLYPNFVLNQDNRGVCHSAAAAMLFSMHLNILLSRSRKNILTEVIDFPTLVFCSSYMNTDLKEKEEKDMNPFNYLDVFSNYFLNRGDLIGVAGPQVVFIKHHYNSLFTSADIPLSDIVPEHRMFNSPDYNDLCKKRLNANLNKILSFRHRFNPFRDAIQNLRIVNPRDAFNNIASLKAYLKAHGPIIFRIQVSAAGEKVLSCAKSGKKLLITAKLCNRFLNSFTLGRHYIIAVGFIKVGNKDYLKFKNSWGSSWAENGYGYLEMNNDGTTCGYKSASQTSLGAVSIEID